MKIYEKVLDWIIPGLLAAAVYFMSEIQHDVGSIKVSLAVNVNKTLEIERRVGVLETERYYEPPGGMPPVRNRPVQRAKKNDP